MITPELGLPTPDVPQIKSSNTYIHPSYPREVDTALEKWGLDPKAKEYLSGDEVDRLGSIIQAARREVESLPEVQETLRQAEQEIKDNRAAAYPRNDLIEDTALTIYLQALPPHHEARDAMNKLVECNLKYAADQARASMNIISGDEETQRLRRERARSFIDITNLSSERAVLADRIQAANMGLMEAAWKYVPGTVNKHGKRSSFLGFAKPHIHARIYDHHLMNEGALISPTPSVIQYTERQKKDFDALPYHRRIEISDLDKLRHPIHIDDDLQPEIDNISIEDTTAEEASIRLLQTIIKPRLSQLSEREAKVIYLRFGLEDDEPRTLDEIGKVIGCTRERVRQLESKAMTYLRSDPEIKGLLNYVNAGRADSAEDKMLRAQEAEKKRPKEWQAYPGERWDDRVILSSEELAERDKKISDRLYAIVDESKYSAFRDPEHKDARQLYPTALVERIGTALGKQLEAKHIVVLWRDHLKEFVTQSPVTQNRYDRFGGHAELDEFSLDRVSQLFSRLFAEYIKNDEEVEISIPLSLDGKLNHLGAWLDGGHLIIHGNVGKYAGRAMGGSGQLTINGNADSYTGMDARAYASIRVNGNATDFAGCQMKGAASIRVAGSVGDYCGYGLNGNEASIEVQGNAGTRAGYRARHGTVSIRGNVGSFELPHDSHAQVLAGRVNRLE